MARFVVNDNLSAGLAELGKLTDDELYTVLAAGASVIENAHKEELKRRFKQHTGSLAESPTITRKFDDGELIARVQPQGKHKGTKAGIRRRKSRAIKGIKGAKHGREGRSGTYEASNAEVAYYLEFGTPRIPASHWMEHANEKAAEALGEAMDNAWDELMESKGV